MGSQGETAGAGAASGDGSQQGHRSAKNQFTWIADEAKAQAAETLRPMKDSARKVAQDQKDIIAERIGGFANAVDAAAGECSRESPATSEMLRAAAGSIRSASDSLRSHGIDDLTRTLQQFAEHRPAALFAGAILTGFALSRFLKSSASQ